MTATTEQASLKEQLATTLKELDGKIFFVSKYEVAQSVVNYIQQRNITHVSLTSEELLKNLSLADLCREKKIEVTLPPVAATEPVVIERWRYKIAESGVGISSALAISAETASALIYAGNPDARFVSLLPEHHIIIVNENQIVPDVSTLFKVWQEQGIRQENAVVISGPSRTADIEKELVLGVHGPCALTMFVIENRNDV